MDYSKPDLSLKNLTTIKIAIQLWTEPNIKSKLIDSICSEINNINQITKQVFQNANQLQLPSSLLDDIKSLIKEIGLQIWNGREIIDTNPISSSEIIKSSAESYINRLCWTAHGKLDKKHIAELFLTDTNNHPGWRFVIACKYYCFQYLPYFWKRITFSDRQLFINDHDLPLPMKYICLSVSGCYSESENSKLLEEIELTSGLSLNEFMTKYAILTNNDVGFEYFWEKLNHDQKVKNGIEFIEAALSTCDNNTNKILLTVFSILDRNKQEDLLKKQPNKILKSLLTNKQWLTFFLPTFELVKYSLFPEQFKCILEDIAREMDGVFMNENTYKILFKQLWQEGYFDWKLHVVENCGHVVSLLCNARDVENIRLISDFAKDELLTRLVKYINVKNICMKLIEDDDWGFLEFFLEAVSVNEEEQNGVMRELFDENKTDLLWLFITKENYSSLEKLIEYCCSQDEIAELKEKSVSLTEKLIAERIKLTKSWKFFDKFLAWCFGSNSSQVESVKQKFVYDHVFDISDYFSKQKTRQFGEFFAWGFNFTIQQRSTWNVHLCTTMLCDLLKFAKKFLEREVSPSFQVNQFKKDLMFSEDGVEFIMKEMDLEESGCEDSESEMSDVLKELGELVKFFYLSDVEIVDLLEKIVGCRIDLRAEDCERLIQEVRTCLKE